MAFRKFFTDLFGSKKKPGEDKKKDDKTKSADQKNPRTESSQRHSEFQADPVEAKSSIEILSVPPTPVQSSAESAERKTLESLKANIASVEAILVRMSEEKSLSESDLSALNKFPENYRKIQELNRQQMFNNLFALIGMASPLEASVSEGELTQIRTRYLKAEETIVLTLAEPHLAIVMLQMAMQLRSAEINSESVSLKLAIAMFYCSDSHYHLFLPLPSRDSSTSNMIELMRINRLQNGYEIAPPETKLSAEPSSPEPRRHSSAVVEEISDEEARALQSSRSNSSTSIAPTTTPSEQHDASEDHAAIPRRGMGGSRS